MNETRIIETLPSVQRLARVFSRRFWADREELVSVGHEAVVHAANDFDATRGVEFVAFAWMRARYAMLEHVRREAVRHSRRPLSLDAPAPHDGRLVLADTIHDWSVEFVHEARAALRLVAGLPPSEREVVTRWARGESRKEIAQALGVSTGRVWQLSALASLRLEAAA